MVMLLSTAAARPAHSGRMRIATRSFFALLAAATLAVVGPVASPSGATHSGPEPRADSAAHLGTGEARIARRVSLTRDAQGYYYSAWGTNNRLTVTLVEGRLLFRDPRPVGWERLARGCRRQTVDRGVAASCRVPGTVSVGNPMRLFLEMRLGDDHVDTTGLPAQFYSRVLADRGREVIRLGAGDDWVNGAFDRDRIWGGDGRDFIRGGDGADDLHGEGGNDELVGLGGNDTLYGGEGSDEIRCGDGNDAAEPDDSDSVVAGCERTTV